MIVEKSARAVLILFLVSLPLVFLSREIFIPPEVHYVQLFTSIKEVTARLLTLVLCFLFVIQVVFQNKPIIKTPLYLPIFLLWMYQGISLLWTENPYHGVEHWIRWGMLFAFFIVCFHQVKKEDIRKYMAISIIPAFLVCLIGMIGYFFSIDLPFFKYRDFPWASTFSTHKFAGEYLAPLIFWTCALYLSKDGARCVSKNEGHLKNIYLFLILFFIFSLFFIFQSRSAIVAIFALMPVLIFREREKLKFMQKKSLAIVLVSVVGALLLVLCSLQGKQIVRNVKSIIDPNFTGNMQRLVMWKNTAKMISDHPLLGVGIGNFDIAYHPYLSVDDQNLTPGGWGYYVRQAHNEYLHIFSESGIIGFFLFFLFLGLIIASSVLYLKKNRKDSFFFSLLLSFLCSLLIAFFVFNLQIAPASYFFILTAVFLAKWLTSKPETFFIKSFVLKGLILSLFLLLAVVFMKPIIRLAFVDYYRRLGQSVFEASGNRPSDTSSIDIFKKALAWDSQDWEIHYLIANAYVDRGFYRKAFDHAKRSFELNPSHLMTLYNIGIFEEKMGDPKAAFQTYERLLHKAPNFRMAANRMGYLLLQQGELANARVFFHKTLLRADNQELEIPEALLGSAYCELKEGNYQAAKLFLLETLFARPNYIDAQFFLKKGNYTELFRWWLTKQ